MTNYAIQNQQTWPFVNNLDNRSYIFIILIISFRAILCKLRYLVMYVQCHQIAGLCVV